MRKTADPTWESRANQEIVRVLEESKALTDSIYDELPIVVVMVDDERRVLKVNREGQRCLKVQEAKVLGHDLLDMTARDSQLKLRAYFADPSERAAFDDEMTIDGGRRYFHWQISPVHTNGNDGRRIHVLIGHDMSESRVALEALVALNKDLEIAGNVQSLLLPDVSAVDGKRFTMAAHYEPSAQVGGDLWWYRELPGKGLLAVMIDVMGHGSGAALAAASIVGCMNQAVTSHSTMSGADMRSFVVGIDDSVSTMFKKTLMASMVAIWLPEDTQEAEMLSLGFPALSYSPAGGPRQRLTTSGNPAGLGLGSSAGMPKHFRMESGDRIVCFTDGCYEFFINGKQFGRRRFEEMLDGVRTLSPSDACAALKKNLRAARDTQYSEDDMTILILDRT